MSTSPSEGDLSTSTSMIAPPVTQSAPRSSSGGAPSTIATQRKLIQVRGATRNQRGDNVPTVEGSITVHAPLAQVFAAVTDPCRAPEWSPRIVEVSNISPYPVQEGTSWRQTAGMGGQTATMQCRIVKLDPPTTGVLEISG